MASPQGKFTSHASASKPVSLDLRFLERGSDSSLYTARQRLASIPSESVRDDGILPRKNLPAILFISVQTPSL